jgi:flagellar biosynthesis chaperone FliJ
MKAFTYRLQRVLDAREAATTHCEIRLAQSERELAKQRGEQERYQQVLHQCTTDHLESTSNRALPAREHLVQLAWKHHLAHRLDQAANAVTKQTATVAQRREDVKKALADKKIIESLSKRERQAWLDKIRKLEQKMQDEQAGIAYSRRQNRHATVAKEYSLPQQEVRI